MSNITFERFLNEPATIDAKTRKRLEAIGLCNPGERITNRKAFDRLDFPHGLTDDFAMIGPDELLEVLADDDMDGLANDLESLAKAVRKLDRAFTAFKAQIGQDGAA